ncbi:MAG TPA: alpha/beta hydrolase [Chloroflexia bacterium]|nr:alpha/beta hydrolase [Chloroflexia bacterium]
MELVRFNTYDEIELAANLYLPEKSGPWSPGIIVCHGFGSGKHRYAEFGERAAAAGYAALIPDLRGHGESGGEVDANIFNDVAAALLYLQNRPEVNPMNISMRGTSLGGWLAIHASAHLIDISPVIAYAPATETGMLVLMEEVGLVQRGHKSPLVSDPPPRVNVNSMVQLLYRVDILKAAKRIHPRPLLLVHCEGDDVVPPHSSQRIYDEAGEPKALWLLPGGDHHFAQHDPGVDERMLAWISEWKRTTAELTSANIPDDVPEDF